LFPTASWEQKIGNDKIYDIILISIRGVQMKIFLILLLTLVQLFSKVENLTINNQPFTIEEEYYDEYGSKGKTVTFYKKEKDGNKISLLSFVLNDATGGCNDKSIEKGTYEINGTTLSFYTLWKRQGSVDDAPFGGRIQRYEVLENGEFNLLSSFLYVETHTEESDNNSGMKFLFEETEIEEDKKLLKKYVSSVEKNFHGTFLFFKEADMLMKKVNKAMSRNMKARWGKRK